MLMDKLLNTDQHAKLMQDLKTAQDNAIPMHDHALRMARVERREHSLIESRNLWTVAGTNGHSIVYGYVKYRG